MKNFEYIRPEIPEKAIGICLDIFDKEKAKDRICTWIKNTLDDVDRQIKYHELTNDLVLIKK